jgi:hypothetical protein
MTLNLNLRRFSVSSMPDNATMICLGKRRTGKTTLVLDILHAKRRIPCGVVISGTEESNHTYKGIVPDLFIYSEYDPAVLERIMERQRKLINRMLAHPETPTNPKVFMILDDVMYDRTIWKSEVIRKIFFNGRHFQVFFMATCQYLMDLPPAIRANLDYSFILREPVLNNRQKIHTYFCGIVPEFKAFCSILDATTADFECLVVDNTSRSTQITDVLFWYKAKIRDSSKWRVGADSFWTAHAQRYREPTDEDEDASARAPSGLRVTKVGRRARDA